MSDPRAVYNWSQSRPVHDTKNTKKGEYPQMDADGRRWTQMDADGRRWTQMDADGRRWTL